MSAEDSQVNAEDVYEALDKDDDGKLTLGEIMNSQIPDEKKKELARAFNLADTDHDGALDEEAWEKALNIAMWESFWHFLFGWDMIITMGGFVIFTWGLLIRLGNLKFKYFASFVRFENAQAFWMDFYDLCA